MIVTSALGLCKGSAVRLNGASQRQFASLLHAYAVCHESELCFAATSAPAFAVMAAAGVLRLDIEAMLEDRAMLAPCLCTAFHGDFQGSGRQLIEVHGVIPAAVRHRQRRERYSQPLPWDAVDLAPHACLDMPFYNRREPSSCRRFRWHNPNKPK